MERKVLIASEGMLLTDGEIYGTKIFLEDGRSAQEFCEVSRAYYERKKEEERHGGTEV